jgi:hypothetical protein
MTHTSKYIVIWHVTFRVGVQHSMFITVHQMESRGSIETVLGHIGDYYSEDVEEHHKLKA